ncbi:uncharacterized protein LOC144927881 [Branchiostoma floridae x Branchiostoma belcheri]
MFPLGRSLVGRLCQSFAGATKRPLATCQVLSSSVPSTSENCSFLKNRQMAAQSAPLVNAVNRRHKWMDVNGHPNSVLPFIRSEEETHLTMWEDACTIDTMKVHLTTLSAAARLPRTTAVSPDPPQDNPLVGQLGTHDGCPAATEQDDGPTHLHELETAADEPATMQMKSEKPNITIKEQQEAVVKVLETVIAHSFYGEGTPWSRQEEEKLLLTHLADLTASERELREKTHSIFKTHDNPDLRSRTDAKTLRRVRKSKRIIFNHLRSMESWERRGACEYEREKRLTYVTLRLEHEADVMEEKEKQRLKNFRGFLRSLGEMLSVWYSGG